MLVDTGVLLRLVIRTGPANAVARRAVGLLKSLGATLTATTQNAAEFWNVCTRPAASRSGYGLSVPEAARKLRLIERLVVIRPDSHAAYREWKRLLTVHSVSGVQVHDARLVAAIQAYGITRLLTFNPNDFKRYAGITALTPQDVVTSPPQPTP